MNRGYEQPLKKVSGKLLPDQYFKSAFARAQDWENPVIADIEDGFELIRRLNANLTQLRRTLKSSVCLLAELEAYLEEILAPLARAAKTEGTGKK